MECLVQVLDDGGQEQGVKRGSRCLYMCGGVTSVTFSMEEYVTMSGAIVGMLTYKAGGVLGASS